MANLDLNHLIAQQMEQQGMAAGQGNDDAAVAQRLRALEAQPPQMARGVDLGAIRDKRYRQHRWTMMATFSVPDEVVQQLADQRATVVEFLADDLEAPEMTPTPIPMGTDNALDMQGPGCVKCGVLWESPDQGLGQMCNVDDRQYEQAKAQFEQQRGMERMQQMQSLVAKAKGNS